MSTFAHDTWAALEAHDSARPQAFDTATVDGVPEPARRLLLRALPAGTPLYSIIYLNMSGEIKLGSRWLPFTARQILKAGVGFVWEPVVGGRIVRFVGADALGPDGARIEFRLFGRIPVVGASGPDVARSAAGRLAAETVAWLPQALTPQAGARWTAIDDGRSIVTLDGPSGPVDVEVGVGPDGALTSIGLERWNDSAKPPGPAPFGGDVHAGFVTTSNVTIAGAGAAGWDWNDQGEADGVFFRYTIDQAEHGN